MINSKTVREVMQPIMDQHKRIMHWVNIYSYLVPIFGIAYFLIKTPKNATTGIQLLVLLYLFLYPLAVFYITLIPIHSRFPTYKSPYRFIPFYNICLLAFYWLYTIMMMCADPFIPYKAIWISIVAVVSVPGFMRYKNHDKRIDELVDIVLKSVDTSGITEDQINNVNVNVMKWIKANY